MRKAHSVGAVTTHFCLIADEAEPLALSSGEQLYPVQLAFETYGELNSTRDNAILVFHALSGSQHAAGYNTAVRGIGGRWTEECYVGWWEEFIGPGKAINTDEFFVICANYLGSCYGSTGPSSIDSTGTEYGSRFPSISLSDVVDSQLKLLDKLGIRRLHAVAGGSLGGMLCLNLALRYPDRVDIVIPIASGLKTTALQRIHNFEQICAIENDLNFRGGDYYRGSKPERGLALARMIGHKTFVSLDMMEERSRGEIVQTRGPALSYKLSHSLESYMLYQGHKFVSRFDANSYLRIMEMWQGADLLNQCGADDWADAFARCRRQSFTVFSIDSDVCYYPEEQQELVSILRNAGVNNRHITVHSQKGHDSFLLEPDLFGPYIAHTLEAYVPAHKNVGQEADGIPEGKIKVFSKMR